MTIVAAQALDTEDRGALELSAMLAQTLDTQLVLCHVVQHRWFGLSPSRSDVEHTASLRRGAADVLAAMGGQIPRGLPAIDQIRVSRSIPVALHEEVIERHADLLVVGSSEDGIRGRISLGSVADRILHSAPVPVAIAPRGYLAPADSGPGRITVAVDSGPDSLAVLRAAAGLALRLRAPLRLVTFAIRRKTMFPPEMGLNIEDEVSEAWREHASAGQIAAIEQIAPQVHAGELAKVSEALVATGRSWDHAIADLDWVPGEIMVMGSSSESAFPKVFLGSTATRLLRAATVPTIIVPPGIDSARNDTQLLGLLGLPPEDGSSES